MASRDPTRTMHFAIARAVAKRTGRDRPVAAHHGDSILAWSISAEASTPALRANYATTVYGAWMLLGLAFVVGLVVLVYPAHLLIGEGAVAVVASATAGGLFFCVAGGAYALWCRLHAAQARRAGRRYGVDSDRYRASMRRALQGNGSLIFQLAVGILAATITSVNWGR